jgi:hypothetical protein
MRASTLILLAVLPLSACGGDTAANDTSNVDQDLAAEQIVTNDVTAIDAATGADANIAADVEINMPTNNAVDSSDEAAENEE